MNKIKNKSMFLLWSGAAISIAEIYTGGLAAPLGLAKGAAAIVLGHIIGGVLLALGGLISFDRGKNAMDTVRAALGAWGGRAVAFLNVLQLLGWSAVMLIQGARGISGTMGLPYNISLMTMAVLVFLWSYCFENKSKLINDISVLVLFLLTILIFFRVDAGAFIPSASGTSFMTVVELSISMCVSWLPLIGDYTMKGESRGGVFVSAFLGYSVASCGMFVLGLAITLFTGMDIIEFIAHSTMPLLACAVVVLSTVTTTFLDIFSAVESSKQIFSIKKTGMLTALYCLIALGAALCFPVEKYESFLLTIGSIFVPVYSIVIIQCFFMGSRDFGNLNTLGAAAAATGFLLYDYFIKHNTLVPTLCTFLIISILYFAGARLLGYGGAAGSGCSKNNAGGEHNEA